MNIFIAGSTGTLGRPLTRALAARGHRVTGLTRSPGKQGLIESLGARPAVADALDPERLKQAVAVAQPEVVIHLLTAIPAEGVLRPKQLRKTNALRIHGTANLLSAALDAGARRMVGESFFGVYGGGAAGELLTEDRPLPPLPDSPVVRPGVEATRSLENQLAAARHGGKIETVALRYGLFYGADVPSSAALAGQLRQRKVFTPRGADGVVSLIHIEDAVAATVAAVEHPSPSAVYNIVDDQPLALVEYLVQAAAAAGAPLPRAVPGWILRLAAPLIAAGAFANLALSNAKARRELGWGPAYPTAREGFRQMAAIGKAA